MKNEKPAGMANACGAVAARCGAGGFTAKHADEPVWRFLSRQHTGPATSATIGILRSGGIYRAVNEAANCARTCGRDAPRAIAAAKSRFGGADSRRRLRRIEAVPRGA